MNLHIVIGISLNVICSGKSLISAYSSMQLHRQDLPISYDYNTIHFYDNNSFKKASNTYQQENQYQVRPQRNGNIQYAPLILNPSEESLRTYYKTTVSSTSESADLTEIGDTTETNNLQPQYGNEHTENRNDNSYTIPLKYFGGYNVKVVPKASEIVYKGDQNVGYGNNYYGYVDRHARNFKSKVVQPYSNKMYVERQKIKQFPRKRPVADPRNLYEKYHRRKPVKQIEVLPDLENARIQPDFNSYFVKAPRVHINIARAYKIAPANDEAPENGLVKRIALNKHKHKFVPNIDALLQKKIFLYPSKNNINL